MSELAAPRLQDLKTVGIAEYAVLSGPHPGYVTYALGSCLGVALWDPVAEVSGMLHSMLPDSSLNPEKAKGQPALFCDTGLSLLLESAFQLGATRRNLRIWLAGAGQILEMDRIPDIGRRNLVTARRLLWKNSLFVAGESTGGRESRTLILDLPQGCAWIRNAKGSTKL